MARIRLPRASQVSNTGLVLLWVLGIVIGLVIGHFTADSRNAAAHKRWGKPIIGTLHAGNLLDEPHEFDLQEYTVALPERSFKSDTNYRNIVMRGGLDGAKVKLWEDDYQVFVQGSRYIGHPWFFRAWRNQPWPVGLYDYMWGLLRGLAIAGWLTSAILFLRFRQRKFDGLPPKGKQPVGVPAVDEDIDSSSAEAA